MKIALVAVALLIVLSWATGSPFDDPAGQNGWIPVTPAKLGAGETNDGQARLTARVHWAHDRWPHTLRRGDVARGSRLVALKPVECIWLRLRWRTVTRKTTEGSYVVHCRKQGERQPEPINISGAADARRLLNAAEFSIGAGPRRNVGSDSNIRVKY